ncbi:BSD-domain-containing protein [Xylariaceae sp. FL0804]|nr:BSD-domain-containing protein [Xylariaceae sp. FL0804]
MDLAYDHLAEENLPKDDAATSGGSSAVQAAAGGQKQPEPQSTLNEDLQEAYRAFSSSTWGNWIGGTVGKVVKQGESVYREASQEVTSLGADATRGLASLRARAISLTAPIASELQQQQTTGGQDDDKADDKDGESAATPTAASSSSDVRDPQQHAADDGESDETVISRLRAEAAKRLKDIQRAEDAADEALLKFGSNIRDFFRDAIVVAPGSGSGGSDSTANAAGGGGDGGGHRFESKDEQGKRVIHTSRYDAQLHVLHTSEKSFTEDPATAEYVAQAAEGGIQGEGRKEMDLARYPELRANLERLVPDRVSEADFWKRYYFLRHSIETAEARRRDLLKAASAEEDVGWGDEDSDDDDDAASPPNNNKTTTTTTTEQQQQAARPGSTESSTTIHPPVSVVVDRTSSSRQQQQQQPRTSSEPQPPRRDNDEKSQPDSDTSYDVVGAASGNPSQAPNSPKEARKVEDESDEEWE